MHSERAVPPAGDPAAWHTLGAAHLRAGRIEEATQAARRAVTLAPRNPTTLLLLGQCAVTAGHPAEARAIADALARLPLTRAEWRDALGSLFTFCEDPESAREFFAQAVSMAPGRLDYRYHLATAQRMTGDIGGALASVDVVLAREPSHVPALYLRSDLRRHDAQHNHVRELSALLTRPGLPAAAQIMLCFALFKELEDLGRDAEAFGHLERGCALQKKQYPYSVETDIDTMGRLAAAHDDIAHGGDPTIGEECIFVFGLPRSGTTLLDRMLDMHPSVRSIGESPAFPRVIIEAAEEAAGRGLGKLQLVEVTRALDPGPIAAAYLAAIRPRMAGAMRYLDKQPLNYLYAGLIARSLPGARLVLVVREPEDACFALYKTLFAGAYPFSYDLVDLGRYYAAWHRLVGHWRRLLGDRLLIVQYEALIADPAAAVRRVLEHTELPWDERCLEFHRNPRAVTTASAAQVRQPIYGASVGKWRRFERHLRPLTGVLAAQSPAGGWRLV